MPMPELPRFINTPTGWFVAAPSPRIRENEFRMFKTMRPGTVKSELHGQPLYKVIVDNRSVHGGSFDWTPYLPTEDGEGDGGYTPGAWTPVIDRPHVCAAGYHLTTEPFTTWAAPGMTVYLAKGRGEYSADGRDTLRITGNKIAFSQVSLIAPADTSLHATKAVIAEFEALAKFSFLNPTTLYYPSFTGPSRQVFDTQRAAKHAFEAAGGGKGYPAAPMTSLDTVEYDELRVAADDLVAHLPEDKRYAAEAFPTNLAFAMAKWAASGEQTPQELTDRFDAYKKGYGVTGRAADGTLYLFRQY